MTEALHPDAYFAFYFSCGSRLFAENPRQGKKPPPVQLRDILRAKNRPKVGGNGFEMGPHTVGPKWPFLPVNLVPVQNGMT